MATTRRDWQWDTTTTDPATAMRALAPIIEGIWKSLPKNVAFDGYTVISENSRVDGVANLHDAIGGHADPINLISVKYSTRLRMPSKRPTYTVMLNSSNVLHLGAPAALGDTSRPVRVTFSIEGPRTFDTLGLMTDSETRFNKEIDRQNGQRLRPPEA